MHPAHAPFRNVAYSEDVKEAPTSKGARRALYREGKLICLNSIGKLNILNASGKMYGACLAESCEKRNGGARRRAGHRAVGTEHGGKFCTKCGNARGFHNRVATVYDKEARRQRGGL